MGKQSRYVPRVALLAVLAATSIVLAGCGSAPPVVAPSVGPSNDPMAHAGETITIIESSTRTQFDAVWAKIPEFTAQTGIEVNLVQAASAEVREKVITSLRLNQKTFDIIVVNEDAGAVAPFMTDLGPYIEADGMSVDDFQGQFPDWATRADVKDGSVVFYPYYAGAGAIAYRKDLFDDPANQKAFEKEYGHPMPVPPKNYEELLELAQFFNNTPEQYGIVFPAKGEPGRNIIRALFFTAGLVDTDKAGYSVWGSHASDENKERAVEVVKYLQDLVYAEGVAPRQVTGMQTDGAAAFFIDCQAAMYMDNIYLNWTKILASQEKCGDVDTFVMPKFDSSGGQKVSGGMRGIPESSEHKEAAWLFLKWLDSEENTLLAVQSPTGTFVPPNGAYREAAVETGALPAAVADAVAGGLPYPLLPNTAAAGQVQLSFFEAVMADQLTPEEYVRQTGEAIDATAAG
jgi:multiple sugar transport system substrate-binding protein